MEAYTSGQEASDAAQQSSSCIAAVIENRAKEVGVAIFDKHSMRLHLVQLVETSRTYTIVADLLARYQPSLLVTVAAKHQAVSGSINKMLQAMPQVSLPRGVFDDTKAILALEQIASEVSPGQLEGLQKSSYLALGASGALMRFMEEEEHVVMAAGSVSIHTIGLEHHMQIDPSSAQALELISPHPGRQPQSTREGTLYRWLNRTKTQPGARLLRANILQPLTDVPTLTLRQDTVEELLESSELAFNTAQGLAQLPSNLDKLLSQLALVPQAVGDVSRRIGAVIQAVLLLRETLSALPALSEGLAGGQSKLIRAMHANLRHPAFQEMVESVNAVLEEDAHAHKQAFVNRTQHCFAVRNNANGLLDIARATFCRLTEEIHALVVSYREQLGVDIKIKYTDKRGFYLILPTPGTETRDGVTGSLPHGFLTLQGKSRKEVHCTTHELKALNTRLQTASHDCMVLTLQVLDGLRANLLQRITCLHKLIDNLALLDMLCAFAAAIQEGGAEFVRPLCTDRGPLAIVQGRHPLLERMEGVNFQPNDTYLAGCSSFYIISGPNMSGKSTYLRQVALIVILAQIGCFVPAKFASLRCVDRLFTRIGTGDSIETNSSTFMLEMQETAYILHNATARSLVLVDELGRATSTTDGTGLAWAVSEHLISLGAATLFASHFARLGELTSLYPNCKLWHFDVDVKDKLEFKWQLKPGNNDTVHYGLLLAPMVGIPEDVLSEAERIAHAVHQEDTRAARIAVSHTQRQLEAVYSLAHKIHCVAQAWSRQTSSVDICHQLTGLKQEANALFPKAGSKNKHKP